MMRYFVINYLLFSLLRCFVVDDVNVVEAVMLIDDRILVEYSRLYIKNLIKY
jgi:hypothetical protein